MPFVWYISIHDCFRFELVPWCAGTSSSWVDPPITDFFHSKLIHNCCGHTMLRCLSIIPEIVDHSLRPVTSKNILFISNACCSKPAWTGEDWLLLATFEMSEVGRNVIIFVCISVHTSTWTYFYTNFSFDHLKKLVSYWKYSSGLLSFFTY